MRLGTTGIRLSSRVNHDQKQAKLNCISSCRCHGDTSTTGISAGRSEALCSDPIKECSAFSRTKDAAILDFSRVAARMTAVSLLVQSAS